MFSIVLNTGGRYLVRGMSYDDSGEIVFHINQKGQIVKVNIHDCKPLPFRMECGRK